MKKLSHDPIHNFMKNNNAQLLLQRVQSYLGSGSEADTVAGRLMKLVFADAAESLLHQLATAPSSAAAGNCSIICNGRAHTLSSVAIMLLR